MKFIANKQSFLKTLSTIEGIISAREIRSPVGNVLIETTSSGLQLTATDLEMTLRTQAEGNVLQPGKILLPARKLSQTIREFRYENLEFSVAEEVKVHIRDAEGRGKTDIEIVGAPADEFQVRLGADPAKYVALPPSVLSDMIDRVSYAIAEDDTRFAFNGMFVENADGRMTVVGTDGRRLSLVARVLPESFAANIIIPIKAVRELRKLLAVAEEFALAVVKEENTVYFRLRDIVFISRLIDSNFPDYHQVVPRTADHRILVHRDDFKQAIKQAAVLAAEPSRQIQLKFTAGEVCVSASTPDLGRVEDTVACDHAGAEITVAFNSNYLLDVLGAIKAEQVEVHLTTAGAPVVFVDPLDAEFRAVIMPMRL